MRRLSRSVLGCGAALLFTFFSFGAQAAERSITLLPDTDLPGFDYKVQKGVDRASCEAACIEDRVCRAFTFNEKAGWCFLKGSVGAQAPFVGATSGIIASDPSPEQIAAAREAELPFPAGGLVDGARGLAAELPRTDPPPPGIGYEDLVAAGDEAVAQGNLPGAMVSYRQALGIAPGDADLWLKLASLAGDRAERERTAGNSGYEFGAIATYAALNAFLLVETASERAAALGALARGLEAREMWREAIATYRASLALDEDAALLARFETVIAQHGFRIVSHHVDAESETPRVCAVFSEPLPAGDANLSDYVVASGARTLAVETENSQICLEGVEHGRRYQIRLRAGLPAESGEQLRKDVELEVYVPDRSPFVAFANTAYVLPAGLGGGLPITSVNAETADAVVYRIGDRSIAAMVRNGMFQRTLDGYGAEDIAGQYGEQIWEGQIALARGEANATAVTAVPVREIIGEIEPGAYVITAKVAGVEQDYWREMATQWFIVTDLGLATVDGDDGVHVFVRSLTTAEPVGGTGLRLVAVNNEILGEARTDAEGHAVFAPGLARGEGGRAPQLLVAETAAGDYAFLDLSRPPFDLSDRGVEGRPASGPLDLFATTERGVYRPGETVFLTALLRDAQARAVTGLPLTMDIERPDGVVDRREVLREMGAGGYFAAVPMVGEAMRGSWQLRLFAEPDAPALANVTFLVEDFEPERLAFEVTAPDAPIATGQTTTIEVSAKYLYGATAPGLAIEADVLLRPVSSLADHPGYVFGRVDDTLQTTREPLGVIGTTDENGSAAADIIMPEPLPTTRPFEAQLILRLVDSSGRPVERSLTRPVRAQADRIGVRPRFDAGDTFAEGSEASFDIIAVAPGGETVEKSGLTWTLSRIETEYQWYRGSDTWRWEPITRTRRVASGSVDAVASGPVAVSAPVEWGRYLFEVTSTGGEPASTSYEFYAGYYYPEPGSDTPDTLQVALDKQAYRIGDRAVLQLEPQFAGKALVAVVANRLIEMVTVDVPAEGTSVALPVTADWGAGAYVTAMLYRPADAAEKRMPARALGLAFAEVDPGDMRLEVDVEAPDEALPRESFQTRVRLANLAPGTQAYVAIAAVDLGILNLTGFEVPDPDGWFFGQRQLGVDIRDLYGQLIDPTQGQPGAVRSGGDGAAARLGTPPPTSVLVALHSGIVEVDADGTATVAFDMPDFNGTVRLMAMAWSADAVGHASKDVIVRDPVVVTLSPPRFLRVGDQSRLLVEINNVAGSGGEYRVALLTGEGIATATGEQSLTLGEGERTSVSFDLSGLLIGDHELRLVVTGPGGDALVKALTLGVRATGAPETVSEMVPLAPGESLLLGAEHFVEVLPQTGSLTLAVGSLARLDVPGLLLKLDRYPYGCSEQISSRVMPLLYLNEVAQMLGLGTDAALDQRIRDAIRDLLSKQNSAGSFGLWGPFSYSDLWLDAYVTEFLLRARDEGYEVPGRAIDMALDNLANQLAYAADFSDGGEDVAYALYDLARAGRAAIGDLRYYLEARLNAFGSPLAKAQLGAALALYGDRTRAATAFAAAVADLRAPEDPRRYRRDYGSRLRDTAAVLALAAEFKPTGVDTAGLAQLLADRLDRTRYTSTQEEAWTLLAAASLSRDAGSGEIMIDDEPLTGAAYRRFYQERIEANPVTVRNSGSQPTEVKVTVTGIPTEAPPERSDGFVITREYYRPDGTAFDPQLSQVAQNDRFVVVLTLAPSELGSGQYVVADPLPAGFEIENPDLSAGAGVADLSWLRVDTPLHSEARTDQYVAAFRYLERPTGFSTAYLVRAVSPGMFELPGAVVEDMYRPELRGNTAAGTVEILPAGGSTYAVEPTEAPRQRQAETRLDR